MDSSNRLFAISSTNDMLSIFYKDYNSIGQLVTDLNNNSTDKAYACVVDSQDRIVVAGYTKALREYITIPAQNGLNLQSGVTNTSRDNTDSNNVGIYVNSDHSHGMAHTHSVTGYIDVPEQCHVEVKPFDYSDNNFCLVRYLNNGVIDETFGRNGVVITDIKVWGTSNNDDWAKSIAIDSKDRIIIIGTTYNGENENTDFAVARYTNAGTLDTRFGCNHNGIVVTDIHCNNNDYAYGVAIDSCDRIVVCGYTESCVDKIALVRYTSWGELDCSFSGDGKLTTEVYSNNAYARSVVIDASDNIIVGGWETSDGANFLLIKYNHCGHKVESFGTCGIFTTDIHCGNDDYGYALAVDASNNIYLAGFTEGCENKIALIKVTEIGELDPTYGNGGIVRTNVYCRDACARAIAIDASGRVVLAGEVENCTTDFLLVRYDLSGCLDHCFGNCGIVETDILGNKKDDYARGIAIDSTGHIIVAGFTRNSWKNRNDFVLARYTSRGRVDNESIIYKEITFNGGETWNKIKDIGIKYNYPDDKRILIINNLNILLDLSNNALLNIALRYDECNTTNYIIISLSQQIQTETVTKVNDLITLGVINVSTRNNGLQ